MKAGLIVWTSTGKALWRTPGTFLACLGMTVLATAGVTFGMTLGQLPILGPVLAVLIPLWVIPTLSAVLAGAAHETDPSFEHVNRYGWETKADFAKRYLGLGLVLALGAAGWTWLIQQADPGLGKLAMETAGGALLLAGLAAGTHLLAAAAVGADLEDWNEVPTKTIAVGWLALTPILAGLVAAAAYWWNPIHTLADQALQGSILDVLLGPSAADLAVLAAWTMLGSIIIVPAISTLLWHYTTDRPQYELKGAASLAASPPVESNWGITEPKPTDRARTPKRPT